MKSKYPILLAILLATSCQQKTEHFEYEALKGQWESEERIANANVVLHFGDSIIEYDPYIGDTIMMLFNPVIQNDTLICNSLDSAFKFKIEKSGNSVKIEGLPIIGGKFSFVKSKKDNL